MRPSISISASSEYFDVHRWYNWWSLVTAECVVDHSCDNTGTGTGLLATGDTGIWCL